MKLKQIPIEIKANPNWNQWESQSNQREFLFDLLELPTRQLFNSYRSSLRCYVLLLLNIQLHPHFEIFIQTIYSFFDYYFNDILRTSWGHLLFLLFYSICSTLSILFSSSSFQSYLLKISLRMYFQLGLWLIPIQSLRRPTDQLDPFSFQHWINHKKSSLCM